MKLFLNEQEIIDGICVFVANKVNGDPEDVDVKEISALDDGRFSAVAIAYGEVHRLDSEDVLTGAFQFLEEYHNFDTSVMVGHLGFSKRQGFSLEIKVNE